MVTRLLQYIFFGLSLFLVLIVVSYVLFNQRISDYLANQITQQAIKHNIILEIEQPKLDFPAFRAGRAKLRYQYKFVPFYLELQEPVVRISLASLLSQPKIDFHAGVLGGQAKAELAYSSGALNPRKVHLHFKDLPKISQFKLPAWATGLPSDLEIPATEIDLLDVHLFFEQEGVKIEPLHFISDWGELHAQGEVKEGGLLRSLNGQLELQKPGQSLLGPYLSIFSSGKVNGSKKFNFRFKGYQGALPLFEFT